MNQNPQELLEQLRTALATALGAPVQLAPGGMSAAAWRLRVTAPGQPPVTLTFDADGAAALATALGKADAVAAALNELCRQAFAGETTAAGETVEFSAAERIDESPVQGITVAGLQSDKLATTLAVGVGRAAASEMTRGAAKPAARTESTRLGVLMDIELPMVVRFGCTDLPLKSLANLGPGSLIDLSRAPEDPVEVLVGGRVVAHGEVVVVSGSYGIRIVDVVEGRSQALGMEA
jgi:flagellar motor switch protein FliN/FliY